MFEPALPHRFVLAALLAAMPIAALAQAQSQPVPQQKSVIIQVAPAPATQAPPPAVALAPAPLAQQPSPPASQAARENPGFINEIGKLFKDTPSLVPSWSLPSLGTGSLNTVVKGRVVCPLAPNGAPDCKAASDKLCQSKGYKEGKSLDTDAAQSCAPRLTLSGQKPVEVDCKTDNYVTQAVCQ